MPLNLALPELGIRVLLHPCSMTLRWAQSLRRKTGSGPAVGHEALVIIRDDFTRTSLITALDSDLIDCYGVEAPHPYGSSQHGAIDHLSPTEHIAVTEPRRRIRHTSRRTSNTTTARLLHQKFSCERIAPRTCPASSSHPPDRFKSR